MWTYEHSVNTSASPETVWKIFTDVPGWTSWNAGIEQVSITGPFAQGTVFHMQPGGQPMLTCRLVHVQENAYFEDETILGDICVLVGHRVQRLNDCLSKITYSVKVTGPGAEHVGPAITEDFPQVMQALLVFAQRSQP